MDKEWTNTSTLKQICDRYIDDSVTEEQVQKVLGPVLILIRSGAFKKPRKLFLGFWGSNKAFKAG